MSVQHFERVTHLDHPADRVFAWHERPGALLRLAPPWQTIRILEQHGSIHTGDRATLRITAHGLPTTWHVEHRDYIHNTQFRDVLLKGPFPHWSHLHRVQPLDAHTSRLIDDVEYELPLLARPFAAKAQQEIEAVFDHRSRTLQRDLDLHARVNPDREQLTVAVTGSHGFIGSHLLPLLTTAGHRALRLVRREPRGDDEVRWDPATGEIDAAKLRGIDAVVHLAGENVLSRWTPQKKRRIRDSRVDATRLLAEALAKLDPPPRIMVTASAIGYYGPHPDAPVTEDSPPGQGFLADVCRAWEAAADPARDADIRVVHPRIGLVLDPRGGALSKMLPPFRLGLGGPVGDGSAWWSWITLDDLLATILFALHTPDLHGPYNAVAPHPVTNRDFTKTLAHVLHRPALLPVPEAALRLAFGEAADEALLQSARVEPIALERADYVWRQPELETSLREMLGVRQ